MTIQIGIIGAGTIGAVHAKAAAAAGLDVVRIADVYSEAEASARQAAAEHERNTKLLPTGAVTQSVFDISRARAERTPVRRTQRGN